MSGLEVVIRPVILPNFRPVAPRVLAPKSDDSSGGTTLGGGGGGLIDLSRSYRMNMSRQTPHAETSRTFDVNRIHQKDENGNVNKDNFVDVEQMRRISAKDGSGEIFMWDFALPPKLDNVSTILSNQTRNVVAAAISGEG